ncbi:MAG: hypothetical protein KKD29_04100 [Candidatus Omnitrophica bacterium]|nr:hypothetical protein [Candidatus Omnitrophota bacterium]MBU4488510.1 hypothetical protein [Candidatus Omnitrophota bacterium]MCG2704578.1 hypothetical protein [Candidatus Omnitrophota bacterium]
MKKPLVFLITLFVACPCLFAQSIDSKTETDQLREDLQTLKAQFEDMKSQYEDKINQLESKIENLEQKTASAETKPAQVAQAPQTGLGRYFQSFNPEISVIGDFIYHGINKDDDDLRNQFSMRQAELAFSAHVDPYARGDFFFHVEPDGNEWHIGLCEGYLTLLNPPYLEDLQAKIGKFKVEFGKANKLHLHALPWVDYPNIITNYFGGEGMGQPGVSLSYLIPNPWDKYIELTAQVVDNHNTASFAGADGEDLVYLTHLKNFFDINEESTIELGGSFATGRNQSDRNDKWTFLEGVDLTYKWRPLKQGLYNSLISQSEIFLSQKQQVDAHTVSSLGLYSSLQYQFAKRWSVFSRYDFSEFPDYSDRREQAVSGGLTFAQSEYCFWRLQYKHTDRNYSNNSDEIWLQCDFGLGPHRKHAY